MASLGRHPVSGISSPDRLRALCRAAEISAVCAVWNVDMKALKIAGAVIGAVIVVIAVLLVVGIPSGFLTAQIQERVERETGYKLAINGGARIGAVAVAQRSR